MLKSKIAFLKINSPILNQSKTLVYKNHLRRNHLTTAINMSCKGNGPISNDTALRCVLCKQTGHDVKSCIITFV